MNENCVIKIKNLSKEYRLGAIGSGTLRHDLQSWYAKKRGKEDPNQRIGAKQYTKGDTFLALDGVNLEVNRGERIGIIGANGAGTASGSRQITSVISWVMGPSGTVIHDIQLMKHILCAVGCCLHRHHTGILLAGEGFYQRTINKSYHIVRNNTIHRSICNGRGQAPHV